MLSDLALSLGGHVASQWHGTEPGGNEVHCELALSLGGHVVLRELAVSLE